MAVLLARGQITIAAIKDGKDGAQGKPGKDGITWALTPDILTYDTDDSGKAINVGTGKATTLRVLRGNEQLTNFTIKGVKNMVNCVASRLNNTSSFYISAITVQKVTLGTDTMDVSCTNGSFDVEFAVDGVTYTATAKFAVNVSAFTGRMTLNNKQYESKFTEISNKFNKDLADAESRITQTAREISLSVSEKSVGRRNMLVGSASRKYGDGFMYISGGYYDGYPLEQIEKNSGIDGVNCIHCRTKQAGTTDYYLSGFRWSGHSPQGNIKLQKGKNYVLSFYAKTHTPNDIYFIAEVLYQGSKIDTSRPAGYAGPTGYSTTFPASEADKWELFTVKVSVPPDALYEYVEINIFARARSYSFVSGYICKPMLEEGENYNGWTLSEQDYDYVGGNLLDNARTLDKSGTLVAINDTVIQNGYGTDSACIKNLIKANATLSDYKEVLRWIFGSTYLVNGNDYIFSFVAKADMDDARVVCYMWSGDIENSCNIFTEGNGGAWDSNVDGNIVFILSRQWTRYWVHWRPKDGYATPKEVIIRHTGNNSTSASTVYVTQPKLEIGATMTEWTERKTDLIDRATAKAAGLEITSSGVTLYGKKIKVENTLSTGQTTTAALFSDGAINAALILAQMLTSQGHNGQMVRIADGLINIYGKAGTANIRFGLNSSGQAVLSYYDDNGNFLYDLGPAGVASLSKTDAKITSEQYIKAEDAGLTTPLGENVDLPWVDTTKSWYTATKDNNYILFVKGATGKKTTLYRYSAPRVNGKIVADSANGLSTYDLASAADGRTFTSRTMVKNGALTNLADGVFLTGDVTVCDNTKIVPSIKKGQSVTRPSFYVQTASFNAKFTTLGWFGRIYSIQTKITFGNLDVGIMSNNY